MIPMVTAKTQGYFLWKMMTELHCKKEISSIRFALRSTLKTATRGTCDDLNNSPNWKSFTCPTFLKAAAIRASLLTKPTAINIFFLNV